jgi:hypothetical protein
VAVTPVGLYSDIALSSEAALSRCNHGLVRALHSICAAAARELGVQVAAPGGVAEAASPRAVASPRAA